MSGKSLPYLHRFLFKDSQYQFKNAGEMTELAFKEKN
jgi:hypothetical protein